MAMEIEQNTISRDWTIIHKGRKFYVNFTESDGQTLALCNRDNWEISEETEDCVEENIGYVIVDMTAEQKRKAEEDAEIVEQLIRFCIENWDNQFMQELRQEFDGQFEPLR
jgi:hypothetical protein